jgi:hypothetical protein
VERRRRARDVEVRQAQQVPGLVEEVAGVARARRESGLERDPEPYLPPVRAYAEAFRIAEVRVSGVFEAGARYTTSTEEKSTYGSAAATASARYRPASAT